MHHHDSDSKQKNYHFTKQSDIQAFIIDSDSKCIFYQNEIVEDVNHMTVWIHPIRPKPSI